MSTGSFFSDAWLGLREPADQRARDGGLMALLAQAMQGSSMLQVVDLGAGNGSNLRALAPLLPRRQQWLLLDHDAQLLAHLPQRMQQWAAQAGWTWEGGPAPSLRTAGREVHLRTQQVDLAPGVVGSLGQAIRLDADTLVTGSALLDLVSQEWLEQLVAECCAACVTLYFSLSYDGRVRCEPQLPDDALVQKLVNQHQLRDKGFGPALGPSAVGVLRQQLARHGYQDSLARSDWALNPQDAQLQHELIEGWATAAIDMELDAGVADRIRRWHDARRALVAQGQSRLWVGHLDILAMPRTNGVSRRDPAG